MRKPSLWAVTGLATLSLAAAACGAPTTRRPPPALGGAAAARPPRRPARSGVILPDATTSPRWEANDRPLLQAAFEEAGIEADIQNADGDVSKFGTLCDGMINAGVNVLMITNLDSESGVGLPEEGAGRRHRRPSTTTA